MWRYAEFPARAETAYDVLASVPARGPRSGL